MQASAAPRQYDVVILGAGAAGLMCAAQAGQRGKRVALLDHSPQPGRKILISGGGRCNFTNLHTAPDRYLSDNPHFAKSALALYQPAHFIELVNRHNIPFHEKTLGQLFCDRSAREILGMLLAECERGKVEIFLNAQQISVQNDKNVFQIASTQGEFHAETLIIATGGLSIPKLGATSLAYDLARQFNLRIVPPRPALVPLTLGGSEAAWTELSGVSTEVIAWTENPTQKPNRNPAPRFREKMLVTHRGLSGPAILQASSYWSPGEPIYIDFAPQTAKGEHALAPLFAKNPRRDAVTFRQALREILPQRLANHLSESAAPDGWTNTTLEAAEQHLRRYAFHPTGTEGYEKAEVTAGGIDTRDLHARTMETRTTPGLFFIGEAVDVTGHLGGYNFQWAWASAVAAANAL
jgi:predicted Rossmann fold flavoprotein